MVQANDRTQLHTDIAVIGAGHAGIEAALAAARLGCDTMLFTMNLDAVGNMPCNPSIGGSGKGHLVFELDALGGEMGFVADSVTLQSRTLNLGKGAAVHAKRVQADRALYRQRMKEVLEAQPRLRLLQAEVVDLLHEQVGGRTVVRGVRTSLGDEYYARAVILCSGTYLESAIFVGDTVLSSGPDGMLPSHGLSHSLQALGIRMMRFKTGTPARVHRRSVNTAVLEEQRGEADAIPFSVRTDAAAFAARTQMPCHIVYTNACTHELILNNLSRSAMYSGNIVGTGPRYCPSIETKLVRFADKERHQLFVEPCGETTQELYLQGFSTSMPTDVQRQMLSTLPGFEHAEIMRYAYAIEYDCIDPTQLLPTLCFKDIDGLYGAGQFNGTSGYEEAAVQGLVAGVNAALTLQGREPMVLSRSSSYIGVLIDDLVTKGTDEPYRIMTSRSEYRLLLRQDNADMRLTEIGRRVGLIDDKRYAQFLEKKAAIAAECDRLQATVLAPSASVNEYLASLGSSPITTGIRLSELLRRPEMTYEAMAPLDLKRPVLPRAVCVTAAINIKYEGYIRREREEAQRQRKLEARLLPPDLDYTAIVGLRLESAEKLQRIRPLNIGQASRISGVNPADISVLLLYLSTLHPKDTGEDG